MTHSPKDMSALVEQLVDLSFAKRDFINELGREITTGIEIGAQPGGYCRLYLYGPDSGIDSYTTRAELAKIYEVLREIFHEATLLAEITALQAKVGGAIGDIADERRRQIDAEGWTPEHDDEHGDGEMADAAACYAATSDLFAADLIDEGQPDSMIVYRSVWPWDAEWWKPKDRRRDLVRAAALIVAEIERIDRKAANWLAENPGEGL